MHMVCIERDGGVQAVSSTCNMVCIELDGIERVEDKYSITSNYLQIQFLVILFVI